MAEPARGGPVHPAGHEIGDQLGVPAAVAARRDDGLARDAARQERGLDRLDVDPLTPDLHLLVAPSQMLEARIGGHAPHVARAVEPKAPAARARAEGHVGQVGPVPVAGRQIEASDHDLADLARRRRLALRVEQEHLHVLHRVPDRHRASGQRGLVVDDVLPHESALRRAEPVHQDRPGLAAGLEQLDVLGHGEVTLEPDHAERRTAPGRPSPRAGTAPAPSDTW